MKKKMSILLLSFFCSQAMALTLPSEIVRQSFELYFLCRYQPNQQELLKKKSDKLDELLKIFKLEELSREINRTGLTLKEYITQGMATRHFLQTVATDLDRLKDLSPGKKLAVLQGHQIYGSMLYVLGDQMIEDVFAHLNFSAEVSRGMFPLRDLKLKVFPCLN